MINRLFPILFFGMFACADQKRDLIKSESNKTDDSLILANMVMLRERAMIIKDVASAMVHFSDDATWINSQGDLFEGKKHVKEFHAMMTGRDSVDYYYEAGEPRIRLIDTRNAIVYYFWKCSGIQNSIQPTPPIRKLD